MAHGGLVSANGQACDLGLGGFRPKTRVPHCHGGCESLQGHFPTSVMVDYLSTAVLITLIVSNSARAHSS